MADETLTLTEALRTAETLEAQLTAWRGARVALTTALHAQQLAAEAEGRRRAVEEEIARLNQVAAQAREEAQTAQADLRALVTKLTMEQDLARALHDTTLREARQQHERALAEVRTAGERELAALRAEIAAERRALLEERQTFEAERQQRQAALAQLEAAITAAEARLTKVQADYDAFIASLKGGGR